MRIARLSPKLAPSLICLLPALIVAGCSESTTTSPTAPDGTPIVFAGTVGHQGSSAHDIVLTDDSLLSITLAEVTILLFDITRASPANLVFGLGLGQRGDDGDCDLSSNVLVTQGQLRIYRLSKNAYCITVFDAGAFPEDALLGYRLKVEITA